MARRIRPRKELGARQQFFPVGEFLQDIVLVCCPNLDGWHEGTEVSYIFYGRGYSIDDPSHQEVKEVIQSFPHNELKAIWRTCGHCRAKLHH